MPPMPVVISEGAFYRYELPLTAPLQLGGDEVNRRRGGLVRVETRRGHVGWGDAAPLPGFSPETLGEVEEQAHAALSRWVGRSVADAQGDLEDTLRALSLGPEVPSSLQFAMEGAAVEVVAAARQTTVPKVLGTPRRTVALNALVPRGGAKGARQAAQFGEEGYRAVKVKVGQRTVEDAIDRVRAIRGALDPSVALRADANRAWTLDEAVAFAEATEALRMAYVEEPLANPARLRDLVEETSLPVALDETTREVPPRRLQNMPGVMAVVLKPTLLGGLRATRSWARAAQEADATPVLSAAYESGVGLQMLVALAATGPDVPVGLSTYDRLAADVYTPPLPLAGPNVDVAPVVDPSTARIAGDRLDLVERYSA